ncbi:MAG: (2Fe-2S)-binding protein [Burkholderiaceae bacterium]|nr:(2Fe-2S)-binding protein [Burkholderiaceae bacterium]
MSTHFAAAPIPLVVNGAEHLVDAAPGTPLLTVLRNDLGLNGPKYGCGLGQCGACTVLVDGTAARACVIPVAGVAGRQVTTLEGLGTRSCPHPVQQAFIDEQAAQCGYCLNGMIVGAVALLRHTPQPTEAEIRAALSGNLCRCGTHVEIVRAVQKAALLLAQRTSLPDAAAAHAPLPGAVLPQAAQPNTAQPEAY